MKKLIKKLRSSMAANIIGAIPRLRLRDYEMTLKRGSRLCFELKLD